MANEQDKNIKDAQFRKGLSIAFFNATNAAIEMVKMEQAMGLFQVKPLLDVKIKPFKKGKKGKTAKKTTARVTVNTGMTVEERIVYWRDLLIKQHSEYYAAVIAPVGVNFEPTDSISRLNAATDLKSLYSAWLSLSEDERHHADVIKVKDELKAKYTKND